MVITLPSFYWCFLLVSSEPHILSTRFERDIVTTTSDKTNGTPRLTCPRECTYTGHPCAVPPCVTPLPSVWHWDMRRITVVPVPSVSRPPKLRPLLVTSPWSISPSLYVTVFEGGTCWQPLLITALAGVNGKWQGNVFSSVDLPLLGLFQPPPV